MAHVVGFARAAMHVCNAHHQVVCMRIGTMRGVSILLVISLLYARDMLAQKCYQLPITHKPLQRTLLDSADEKYTSCSLAFSIPGGGFQPGF